MLLQIALTVTTFKVSCEFGNKIIKKSVRKAFSIMNSEFCLKISLREIIHLAIVKVVILMMARIYAKISSYRAIIYLVKHEENNLVPN